MPSSATTTPGHQAPRGFPDAAIELAEGATKVLRSAGDFAARGNAAVTFYNGMQAFRKYDWLKAAPSLNKSGNLRGMVLDKQARVAFSTSVEFGRKLEIASQYLVLASVAIDIAQKHEDITRIINSNESGGEKAQKLITLGSMSIFKAVSSPIPAVTSLVAKSLEKTCSYFGASEETIINIRAADLAISSSCDQIMDYENVVHFINTNLVIDF